MAWTPRTVAEVIADAVLALGDRGAIAGVAGPDSTQDRLYDVRLRGIKSGALYGAEVVFLPGGAWTLAGDSDPAAGWVALTPPLSFSPAGLNYIILREYRLDALLAALRAAVAAASDYYPVHAVYETTQQNDTYVYPVPSGWVWLSGVRYQPTQEFTQEDRFLDLLPSQWRIIQTPDGPAVLISRVLQGPAELNLWQTVPRFVPQAGLKLRLIGMRPPALPSGLGETLEVDPEYARLYLLAELVRRQDPAQYRALRELAELRKKESRIRPPNNSVPVRFI